MTKEETRKQRIRAWTAEISAFAEEVRREQREKDARLAEDPYGDEVAALGGDEPKAVGRKIARAILRNEVENQRG